jgi:hypothetical protein
VGQEIVKIDVLQSAEPHPSVSPEINLVRGGEGRPGETRQQFLRGNLDTDDPLSVLSPMTVLTHRNGGIKDQEAGKVKS